jgi:hypothetical protein
MRFFVYLYDLPGFSEIFFKVFFMLLKAKEVKNLFDYYTKREL